MYEVHVRRGDSNDYKSFSRYFNASAYANSEVSHKGADKATVFDCFDCMTVMRLVVSRNGRGEVEVTSYGNGFSINQSRIGCMD
jgi:hypothetical protein